MTATWTVVRLLGWAAPYLESHGSGSPRLDAELLLAAVLGCSRLELYLHHDRPLDREELAAFKALLLRRRQREPMAYILGEKEFWSLPFRVSPAVLIPRPETEHLVEEAIRIIDRHYPEGAFVVDFGTGCGNIILSLAAHYRQRPGYAWEGIDRSPAAVEVARANAERLDLAAVTWRVADLEAAAADPARPWQLVVSNPPYIPAGELAGLAPEVRQEPREALDGGRDGLDYYRVIARRLPALLPAGGWLLLEVGAGQAPAVADMLTAAGAGEVARVRDLQGIERVVVCQWMP
ncbi:MAG: peptide chain release factor N(5)-glutamine methyltransferase [Deltaproteobacteria bacterium]|nr:peptide chain release factor N(5)-glutamine methyltransferase [Deltaproteobacteria bacterium]